MPEVSLVAILDADKEGFLRSERSLIQTIGRAARNLKGRAILYGDRITGSMKKAIEKTNSRRDIQHAYNVKHGITPKGLIKKITDVMDVGEKAEQETKADILKQGSLYNSKKPKMDAHQIGVEIKRLEAKMLSHARDLEFEQAAKVRDEIQQLHDNLIHA
jgi:excinuclease ABC subunit B